MRRPTAVLLALAFLALPVAVVAQDTPGAGALTAAERAEILDLYDRSLDELQELVAKTPDELWATKPAPDKWSVSEVVEHLAIVEPLLGGLVQQTLAGEPDPNWSAVEQQRSIDDIVRNGTNRANKLQAPDVTVPKGGMSRADGLSKLAGARAVNADFVRRSTAELKRYTAEVPNAGTMTMHQALAYIAIHNLRHNAQIAEALAMLQK
jgi:uncharacterized damage-inducible protein DinB